MIGSNAEHILSFCFRAGSQPMYPLRSATLKSSLLLPQLHDFALRGKVDGTGTAPCSCYRRRMPSQEIPTLSIWDIPWVY